MIARRTLLLAALTLAVGCGRKEGQGEGAPTGPLALNGAGATFPYPLYSKWMSEYNKLHPEVRINYQSIGSGGGIRQIMAGTVDFGATDAPMTPDEEKKAPRKLWHLPVTIGAVVVVYNLPGVTNLQLAPDVLADVYLGKITRWNDARLAQINPGVSLPDSDIKVVYRSDGSGTTSVFTEYLAKVSADWKEKVGEGKSVKWPVGLGAKGNEGVSGQTKITPGSIGYVELAYARQNKMSIAALRNRSGKYVAPSPEASTAAAKGVEVPPETLTASLTDSPAPDAYPVVSYTYILVYEDQQDERKGEALVRFLSWAITDGQKFAHELDYAPLPEPTIAKVRARLGEIRSGQKKLLGGS